MPASDRFTIRPARAEDRREVLDLIPRLRAFGPPPLRPPEALDAGEQRTLDRFFAQQPANARLWVAEGTDSAMLGAAYAEEATDYFTQETHGHLGILIVAASAEGLGIGPALMRAVEQWAADRGDRFLTLNVFAGNTRAIGLYEHLGYGPDTIRYVKTLR